MAQLKATIQFNSFGTEYLPGDLVDEQVAAAWPEGTLATRIANGHIVYVAPDAPAAPTPIPTLEERGAELAKLTKEQLVEHGATLGLTLDIGVKKDELIAAILAV